MNVTQISINRFHHFHLARQLERHGVLKELWTGYPKFKLKDEAGIPPGKIRCFPWLQTPYIARGCVGLSKYKWLSREWAWHAHQTLDRHVASQIADPGILFALSGSGLLAGRKMQSIGGGYVCDRGSSHIRYQNDILHEEYARWGLKFGGVDPRSIEKEESEYEAADIVTVASEFVRQSFIKYGVAESKIKKIPYGARIERFKKTADPSEDCFRVLWVGSISIRKGFLDALAAFQKLSHRNKEFRVVGSIEPAMQNLLKKWSTDNVKFVGSVPNKDLVNLYSTSHIFLLPSIEDGFGMVLGEALACGCPVIASENTGGFDLFTDCVEGFIVPIRRPDLIADRLQQLADEPELRRQMSNAALKRVETLGGWDVYGDNVARAICDLVSHIAKCKA